MTGAGDLADMDVTAALTVFVALGNLSPNEREAFVDHVILNHPAPVISVRMGISRSRVHQLISKARRKIHAEVLAA